MKKIMCILVAFVSVVGVTSCAGALEYKPYFSIGGGLYDSRVNISRGNASVSSNGLSLTATGGVCMNQYFSAEVNALVNQLLIEGNNSKSDVTFIGVMPGLRVGVKLLGVFYPYVGVSAGPSFATNKYTYAGVTTKHETTTFAYQARAGVAMNIGAGAGVDVGVRYANQGHLSIDGMEFGIDGNVTSFNYYITASYGF